MQVFDPCITLEVDVRGLSASVGELPDMQRAGFRLVYVCGCAMNQVLLLQPSQGLLVPDSATTTAMCVSVSAQTCCWLVSKKGGEGEEKLKKSGKQAVKAEEKNQNTRLHGCILCASDTVYAFVNADKRRLHK